MKKVFLAIILAAISFSVHAQTGEKVIMPKLGYQTDFERFLIGVEGRYSVTENIRLAPGVSLLVPNKNILGFDVDINVHYVFPFQGGLSLYPFAGGAMLNNRFSKSGFDSVSWTDFGFNIGGGAQYDVMDNAYINFEFKYTFREGKDPAYFTLGYGVKF